MRRQTAGQGVTWQDMAAVEVISDMLLATGVQVGREVFSRVQVFLFLCEQRSGPVLFASPLSPRGGVQNVRGREGQEGGGRVRG